MNLNAKRTLHETFWKGEGPCLILIPNMHMPPYDTRNYKEKFYDPKKMWQSEIERAKDVNSWPTDGIATVRPNLGTVFIPAILGQSYTISDSEMPWPGEPLTLEELSQIGDREYGDAALMHAAKQFYKIHKEKCQDDIVAYLPDTQGAFDIAHLIYGDEIFYDLATPEKAETLHKLLSDITGIYIDITSELKRELQESNGSMVHGHGTAQGVYFPTAGTRISEDTATLLSPSMINEFIVPYVKKASEAFGGAFFHFCGHHKYLFEVVTEIKTVKAIDLGNPERYETRWLLQKCAQTETVFFGRITSLENECWQEYVKRIAELVHETGARCILRPTIFPESYDECMTMLNMWHEMTTVSRADPEMQYSAKN